ncbi:MAG: hypothetical protein IKC13_03620 [Elusimicrobiaceae bacterium]|nr:hypothetical protein [Elusimicrobiaceae bacterium]
MKKLFVLLCLFVAAVAMGSNAFAQKADVSYYGGVLKYQKYEPWYYQVHVSNKRLANKLIRESLASLITGKTPKQDAAWEREDKAEEFSEAVITKKATDYFYQTAEDTQNEQAKFETIQKAVNRYSHFEILTKVNFFLSSDYALLEAANESSFYVEASAKAVKMVEFILESEPKQRSYPVEAKGKPTYPNARPEPKNAFETSDHRVVVTFDVPQTDGEVVQLVFDTKKYTIQIYNKELIQKTRNDHDLMDLKPWH